MKINKVLIAGLLISIFLFIGRISGFVRELVIANKYGATAQADVAIYLLSVSDLLVNLIVGGAISYVLVPKFLSNNRESRKLYAQCFVFALITFTLLSLLLGCYTNNITSLIAPGINLNAYSDLDSAIKIVLFSIPLTVTAGVVSAWLNVKKKFILASCGTLIFNSSVIAILLSGEYVDDYIRFTYFIACAALLGSFVRLMSLFWERNSRFNLNASILKFDLITKDIFSQYFFVLMGGIGLLLLPVIVRSEISGHGEGFLSMANYAVKLVDLPLAIGFSAISILLLPKMSSISDSLIFTNLYHKYTRLVFYSSCFITVLMVCYAEHIVNLVYGWGDISKDNINVIVELFKLAILSLPLQALININLTVFASRNLNLFSAVICGLPVCIFLVGVIIIELEPKEVVIAMDMTFLSIVLLFKITFFVVFFREEKISTYIIDVFGHIAFSFLCFYIIYSVNDYYSASSKFIILPVLLAVIHFAAYFTNERLIKRFVPNV